MSDSTSKCEDSTLDEVDRKIILATQAGLPIVSRPYDAVGQEIGITGREVQARMTKMLESGKIRRIAAVPNHYALGYKANGMTVWDIPDEHVVECGEKLGQLPNVSHCYRRPRHLPLWQYNLFAMLHGKTKDDVVAQMEQVAEMLSPYVNDYSVLFSSAILKKTGLRIKSKTPE